MKAVDLFCGRGGWTKGLLAAGFDVVGVDLEPQPDYPAEARLLCADICELSGKDFRGVDVVVASPPCQGFSLQNRQVLEGHRPNAVDFRLVCETLRFIQEAEPRFWAVENVRGAAGHFRALMGDPKLKNGPWFVWGKFPGFLLEKANLAKFGSGTTGGKYTADQKRAWANASPRKRAALAAEIPGALAMPLAAACAQAFGNLEAP
jgi:hypothetical protein